MDWWPDILYSNFWHFEPSDEGTTFPYGPLVSTSSKRKNVNLKKDKLAL